MKKLYVLIFMLQLVLISCHQFDNKSAIQTKQEIKENVRYKLFPTDNIWTFLKLDTSNGKIWQVQYAINDSNRGEVVLNSQPLASGDAAENGRFTLYQTRNMYNFILLDQKDGKMWQVQWSIEEENRIIIPMQY